jgi:hypothetical protein
MLPRDKNVFAMGPYWSSPLHLKKKGTNPSPGQKLKNVEKKFKI